jgi:predicted aldo/keto reductase-like oxidoreductase
MEYRTYGNLGYTISALGFGAMRLPMKDGHVVMDEAVPLIRHAFDQGVNYVDSARGYCGGESQVAVGKAVKGYRDKVFVSTKNPEKSADGDAWWRNLEESLSLLDESVIDFYHCHGLRWSQWTGDMCGPGGPKEMTQKALEQGCIRHRVFSSHDTPENIIKLVETDEFDGMLVQYNLLDRANEEAIARAAERGMGVVVMGPVGGGRLAGYSDEIRKLVPGGDQEARMPALALRFVLSNRNVTCALSGMTDLSEVDENVRTVSEARLLTDDEWSSVGQALDRLRRHAELYCTGCNYCMPCPHGVNIPGNFTLMNYYRVYGLKDLAIRRYRAQPGSFAPDDTDRRPRLRASACQACKACLDK